MVFIGVLRRDISLCLRSKPEVDSCVELCVMFAVEKLIIPPAQLCTIRVFIYARKWLTTESRKQK